MVSSDLINIITKLAILIAMAIVVGGGFVYFLMRKLRIETDQQQVIYLRWGARAGLLFSPLYFLIQVGAVNQSGPGGMFDLEIARILLGSGVGIYTVFNLCGFALVLFALTGLCTNKQQHKDSGGFRKTLAVVSYVLGAVFISGSIRFLGHTAELDLLGQVAAFAHVTVAFIWIGSLFPLLKATNEGDRFKVQQLMKYFGDWSVLLVAVLVVSGLYLSTALVSNLGDLFSTAYGSALVLKVVLVASLLLLATSNKFQIVPKLENPGSVQALRQTISMEIVLAGFVLALTAYFTSLAIGIHG